MGQMVVHVARAPMDRYGSLRVGDGKKKEREEVWDFIAPRLPTGKLPRVVTMPSNNWEFEVAITRDREIDLLCVERDWWRIEQSRYSFPDSNARWIQEVIGGFEAMRGFASEGRTIWTLFYGDLASLLKTKRQEKKVDGLTARQAKRRWIQLFKRWHGAWIDLTGPLDDEFVTSLPRIGSHADGSLALVIGYGVGRERGMTRQILQSRSRIDLVMDGLNSSSQRVYDFTLERVSHRQGLDGYSHRETLFITAKEAVDD